MFAFKMNMKHFSFLHYFAIIHVEFHTRSLLPTVTRPVNWKHVFILEVVTSFSSLGERRFTQDFVSCLLRCGLPCPRALRNDIRQCRMPFFLQTMGRFLLNGCQKVEYVANILLANNVIHKAG